MKELVYNNGSPYYSVYWSNGKADFNNKEKAKKFFEEVQ